MPSESFGTIKEKQVRNIAARLGVADFVYYAPQVKKGSALREASGDGLLIVGQRGAILQVKARDPQIGQIDTEARARSWICKNANNAKKQGLGTKRELSNRQKSGKPIVVWPVRAAHLPEDIRQKYGCLVTQDINEWPIIVIVDHPQIPKIDLEFVPGIVWFTFRDWLELQRRLRSTAATIEYVQRILLDKSTVTLGYEAERYAAMRLADERSTNGSDTLLPYLAHRDNFDELGSDLFHDVINKVWPDDGEIPWRSAQEYRKIVEFLDMVPPTLQAEIGRWFLQKRSELTGGRKVSSGMALLNKRDRLLFACSDFQHWASIEHWRAEITTLALLRHIQSLESGALDNTITLAIGALVEAREERTGVSYIFIMLDGREAVLEIPTDIRRNYEWRYGIHNHHDHTTIEPIIGEGELCPCMNGKIFKNCCGQNKDH